jgi:L-alanine-DL-glutamate epimerase-like enolase superfamily enzyme
MRIVDIRERTIDISRYADPTIPSGGLTTSLVAVITDAVRDGAPVVGYGFSSIGRYGQPGLIRERFAPRLRAATTEALVTDDGTNLDPFRAWSVMMAGEKPGGHGERCVAVGTLDMALWDATAKIAELPLHQFLAGVFGSGGNSASPQRVPAYAGGGYLYPHDDITRLTEEIQRFLDLGFTHAKIKIGAAGLAQDRRRIEAATRHLDPARLAVDAMNTYDAATAMTAATELAPFGLWWFEDICDPLDFDTQARVGTVYANPIAAGEALFSVSEAKLLDQHGGLRRDRDVLVFDPVHCYGLPGYLRIVDDLTNRGWHRHAFWPHGGHLFSLHVVAALGLGGAEINPLAFAPFRGLPSGVQIADGFADLPDAPGIGFELHDETRRAFQPLLAT